MGDSRVQVCRPLRRDAERNRQRILAAARRLFAERGMAVSHDQLAEAAQVAVGTVYRRFPDKDSLLEALFADDVDRIEALGRAAAEIDDPWRALVHFVTESLEIQAGSRGFREFLMSGITGDSMSACRGQLLPMLEELVARGHAAGVLRAGVDTCDLGMIPLMMSPVMDGSWEVCPELWRRALDIVLAGLRAGSEPEPLPEPDLAEPEFLEVMRCAQIVPGRR